MTDSLYIIDKLCIDTLSRGAQYIIVLELQYLTGGRCDSDFKSRILRLWILYMNLYEIARIWKLWALLMTRFYIGSGNGWVPPGKPIPEPKLMHFYVAIS